MGRNLVLVVLCIVFLVVLCIALSSSALTAQHPSSSEARLINVSGEAQVNVIPDEIVVSIGVQACGDTASQARDNEAALAKSVVALTNKLGIEPKLVRTSALEIDLVKPENHDWRVCYDTNEKKKYGARQMFRVTLRDTSKLTPLLTEALGVGATRVLGVEYRTTDLRKYRDQARSMAIKAAKEKATALAADLGQRVGRPHTISETPHHGRDWNYYGYWWSYGSGGLANASQNIASAPGEGPISEEVALGQIGVTARVTVSFELE